MRFSIVTPAFNSETHIAETIEGVISQRGHFSVELLIMDGGSKDGTEQIVRGYQDMLLNGTYPIHCDGVVIHWQSERDAGMYDAIKKGFTRADGDVYAWINSDDIYLPGAFEAVARAMEAYPEILWIKGITSYINEHSTVVAAGDCNLYRQDFIRDGLYGPVLNFIQQDSVFWRAQLWHESGGVDEKLSLAGDYFLWRSFAGLTPLYSLNAYVSCFRRRPNQKSADMRAYFREIEGTSRPDRRSWRTIRRRARRMKSLPAALQPLYYRLFFGRGVHRLVVLENGVVPRLIEGGYFALQHRMR